MYTSIEKANKNSKIKEPKPKVQEPKRSDNSSETKKTFNKAQKEKKKYWRQKYNKKDFNVGFPDTISILISRVNIINNFSRKKHIQTN